MKVKLCAFTYKKNGRWETLIENIFRTAGYEFLPDHLDPTEWSMARYVLHDKFVSSQLPPRCNSSEPRSVSSLPNSTVTLTPAGLNRHSWLQFFRGGPPPPPPHGGYGRLSFGAAEELHPPTQVETDDYKGHCGIRRKWHAEE